MGQTVVLYSPVENSNNREATIRDALLSLDKAAKMAKKRVIIFMNEFQQIGQLRDKHVIEASIRHAVERSQYVSYIFSGSNRHVLLEMFSNKNRPFYKLCATISLKRITEKSHTAFIQKHAEKKWRKPLKESVMDEIIKLSECHPYYLNLICNYFWQNNEYPTVKKIGAFWDNYVETQKSIIAYDISGLSNNQKLVLKDLAIRPANQPYGNESLKRTGLTIASQKLAIQRLHLMDFIFKDEYGFLKVLEPAVKTFILKGHVN